MNTNVYLDKTCSDGESRAIQQYLQYGAQSGSQSVLCLHLLLNSILKLTTDAFNTRLWGDQHFQPVSPSVVHTVKHLTQLFIAIKL